MDLKGAQILEFINNRLANIEKNIARLDEKLDFTISLSRNHLIRLKNGEQLDDSMILLGRPYNDLSPQKAYEIYQNANLDFIVLDVSARDAHIHKLNGSIHIPMEELERRFPEIYSKTTPLLIICENGVRSIKAAEFLIKKGYFNVNIISGGHEFWPERHREISSPKDLS